MLSQQSHAECPDCRGTRLAAAFVREPKDDNYVVPAHGQVEPHDGRYVIMRCEGCGSIFLHPHYWAESFAVYSTGRYFAGYFPNNIHPGGGPNIAGPLVPAYSRLLNRRRARFLLKQAGLSKEPGTRVLDIGCASGQLVQGFSDLGCDAYGVDVSTNAIANAANKTLKLRAGLFEETDYPDAFFDLIVSIETVEHMGLLDQFLSRVLQKLKPDGRFVLQVPNDIDGYRARAFRRIWWMIPPMHLRYFTKQSMSAIMARQGFRLLRARTAGQVGDDWGMMLTWRLKRLGLRRMVGTKVHKVLKKGLALLGKPVDYVLNVKKVHTELLLVFAPGSAPDAPRSEGAGCGRR